jgi:hypothetical protein
VSLHSHRATRVHARPRGRAVTGPRVRADARSRARASAPRPRGCGSTPVGTRACADAVFTASARKTASAGKRGRARTSGRKGCPDGHFLLKTSFMTSLAQRGRTGCSTSGQMVWPDGWPDGVARRGATSLATSFFECHVISHVIFECHVTRLGWQGVILLPTLVSQR